MNNYDSSFPFGRSVGSGAPIRDSSGNIITNRNTINEIVCNSNSAPKTISQVIPSTQNIIPTNTNQQIIEENRQNVYNPQSPPSFNLQTKDQINNIAYNLPLNSISSSRVNENLISKSTPEFQQNFSKRFEFSPIQENINFTNARVIINDPSKNDLIKSGNLQISQIPHSMNEAIINQENLNNYNNPNFDGNFLNNTYNMSNNRSGTFGIGSNNMQQEIENNRNNYIQSFPQVLLSGIEGIPSSNIGIKQDILPLLQLIPNTQETQGNPVRKYIEIPYNNIGNIQKNNNELTHKEQGNKADNQNYIYGIKLDNRDFELERKNKLSEYQTELAQQIEFKKKKKEEELERLKKEDLLLEEKIKKERKELEEQYQKEIEQKKLKLEG